MKVIFTLLPALLLWANTHAANRTVIANNDQGSNKGWQNPNNWNPIGVPQSGDVVIIPSGQTISVKGNVYSTVAVTLTINVYGTLDFDPSGTLNLSRSSIVQLFNTTSRITSNGTSSEQIIIDGNVKYNGQTDGTITGPAYTSYATSNSMLGTPGAGFVTGVLPIKLTSFTAHENGRSVAIAWSSELETNLGDYELQRSANGRNWKALTQVTPKNTCHCTTLYQYKDAFPEAGTNYYRLLSRDLDGKIQFSPIIVINTTGVTDGAIRYDLIPGGSTLALHINAASFTFPVQIQLISSNGQILQKQTTDASTTFLNTHSVARGMAVIALQDKNGKVAFAKIIK